MNFSPRELIAIANALRVAAEVYILDASKADVAAPRLAQGFRDQAAEAKRLAAKIEAE